MAQLLIRIRLPTSLIWGKVLCCITPSCASFLRIVSRIFLIRPGGSFHTYLLLLLLPMGGDWNDDDQAFDDEMGRRRRFGCRRCSVSTDSCCCCWIVVESRFVVVIDIIFDQLPWPHPQQRQRWFVCRVVHVPFHVMYFRTYIIYLQS